jgi:hypothetical protein
MRQSRSLIFGLIAVGLAVVSSIFPATPSRYLFSIDSKTSSRIDVPLARHSPKSIKIEVECPQDQTFVTNIQLLSTVVRNLEGQGLYLFINPDGIEVVIGQMKIGGLNCGSISLMATHTQWSLLNNNQLIESIDTPIQVSTVVLNQDALDSGFAITTQIEVEGSETSNGLVRWFLWIAAISAIVGSLIVSKKQGQKGSSDVRWHFRKPDFIDLAFTVLLVFWALVGPVYLDDGWVTLTSRLSTSWNNYFSVFQVWDARVPIGVPQYLAYHLISGVSQNLIVLRLIPVLVIFVGWRCVRSIMSQLLWSKRPAQPIYIFIVYSSFAMSWLMTIRPEPFVSTLSLLSLHHVLRFQRQRVEFHLLTACIYSGLALGVHTSGAVALTPLFYGLWLVLNDPKMNWPKRASITIQSICVLVFLGLSSVFIATDFFSWQADGSLFEKAIGQLGFGDETQRYKMVSSLFPYDTMLRRLYLFLFGLCALLSILPLNRRRFPLGLLLTFGSAAFLLVTPTKWPWHFGSTVGLLSIALLLLISEMSRFKPWSIILGCFFAFAAVFNITKSPEGWGMFFPNSPKSEVFAIFEDILRNPWVATGAVVVLALSSIAVPWEFLRRDIFALLVLTPSVFASLLPLSFGVRDLGAPNSIASMNLSAIRHQSHCGLGSSILTPDLSTASPLEVMIPGSTYPLETSGGNLEQYVSPTVESEFLITPWMRLSDLSNFVVLPISGDVTDASPLEIQFSQDFTAVLPFSDTTIRQQFLDGSRVTLGPLNPPSNTTWFRFRLLKSDSNKIGIPQSVRLRSLADLDAEGRSIQVDPFFKSFLPCMGDRTSRDGLATTPDFVIGGWPLAWSSSGSILLDTHDIVVSRAYLNGGIVFPVTWVLPLVSR